MSTLNRIQQREQRKAQRIARKIEQANDLISEIVKHFNARNVLCENRGFGIDCTFTIDYKNAFFAHNKTNNNVTISIIDNNSVYLSISHDERYRFNEDDYRTHKDELIVYEDVYGNKDITRYDKLKRISFDDKNDLLKKFENILIYQFEIKGKCANDFFYMRGNEY